MDVSGARSRLQLLASGRDVLQSIDQLVPSASDRDTLIVRCGRLVEELQAAGSGKAPTGSAAAGADGAPASHASASSAPVLIEELNCLTPRGKHSLGVDAATRSLVLRAAKSDVVVPVSAVTAVAILDNIPQDTKGKVLMLVSLKKEANVMSGKTRLESLLMQWVGEGPDLDLPNPLSAAGDRLRGAGVVVLCQLLGLLGVAPASFHSADPDVFASARGALAVGANVKVSSGFLFPLATAFAFLERPALFVPHASVARVEMIRANGVSSTFDVVLELQGGERLEFGQIDRAELGRVQSYMARTGLDSKGQQGEEAAAGPSKPAAGRGSAAAEGTAAAAQRATGGDVNVGDANDDDDSDDDDSDFDPEGSEDDTPRQKVVRRAAAAAGGGDGAGPSGRAGDDDDSDSDDEDFAGSDGASGSDGDDDSDDDDDDDDDEDEEVELTDEEGITAEQLNAEMAEDKGGRGKRRSRAEFEA